MHDRSIRETKELIAPLPFALLTLVFATLLGTVADITVGVNEPFSGDLSYYAVWRTYGHWITSLQKFFPVGFSAPIVLYSLKFSVVLLVLVFWARALAGSARRYWADVAALLYLLPFVLIAEIVEYCAFNLTFRMIGEHVLLFEGAKWLITMLSLVIVYGIVLKVVDQVYFAGGWRRVLHLTGYVIVVPVLLFVLNAAFFIVPVGIYSYRVISPTIEGDAKLDTGDYEAAEKLFVQAIKNDVPGVWSAHAHIRLVSANARRILALLPDISGDSGMRERLLRHFVQTDPFRRVANVWRPKGSINVTPTQLVEFREAILHSFLTAGDIPVTTSELNCALRSTAADENCDDLPKEAVTRYVDTPIQRQRLYYLIYRARALRGEPTTIDARRYLQFLLELPIRIEIMFVRYRALNLARESETLAFLDDQDRSGNLDREYLIKGNREIPNHGDKFPHLMIPDAAIEKLSDRKLGFYFRQVYLNYLGAEARLLATSRISGESSLIRQQAVSMEEQLTWVANDAMYRDIPPENRLEQALVKLFGMESEVVNTSKGR